MTTIDDNETTDVTERIEQTNTGVRVVAKSKRGTGTRDQDSVTVEAHYDDETEAYNNTDKRTSIVYQQMKDLRELNERGHKTQQ